MSEPGCSSACAALHHGYGHATGEPVWHPPLLVDGVPCDHEDYEPCTGQCCGRGHCTCDPEVYAAAVAKYEAERRTRS